MADAQGNNTGAAGQAQNTARFAALPNPLITVQDRLFHTLFFRLTLAYARGCPKPLRRIIEMMILVKALLCFAMLVYIHLAFARHPVKCLEEVKDTWPRDGILRVEIMKEAPSNYGIDASYEKERNLQAMHRNQDEMPSVLGFLDLGGYFEDVFYPSDKNDSNADTTNTPHESAENSNSKESEIEENTSEELQDFKEQDQDKDYEENKGRSETGTQSYISSMINGIWSKDEENSNVDLENNTVLDENDIETSNKADQLVKSIRKNAKTISELINEGNHPDHNLLLQHVESHDDITRNNSENGILGDRTSKNSEFGALKEDVTEMEKIRSVVWPEEEYIVEYSLEYGFLRLSPATRQKLNLTVHILVLDPSKNACFGDSFSQFILQNFLGYDDVLMSSIKSLAESEDNKGYLRNVVTGAHYHFVSRWTSSTAYIVAALVMMVFTVSISMLLRYSQHQIFVFIVELLQMLEFNTNISFPAAPLLTVILALVAMILGMQQLMTHFVDRNTAFCMIVVVWYANEYYDICCHTRISRKYWPRFFYLYQFLFYAHYMNANVDDKCSKLALMTTCLLIQHSMIYFFHHYELPVILQQAHTQDLLMRNQEGGGPPLIVAYEQGGHGAITINRRANRRDATGNNNNNNAVNNNNGGNVNVNRRMTGFNFGPFRFRLGVVLTTHQRNDVDGNQQPSDNPPTNHGHSHGHLHGQEGRNQPPHNPPQNHGHSHGHSHGHQHMHQHLHSHMHSHSHLHNRNDSSSPSRSVNVATNDTTNGNGDIESVTAPVEQQNRTLNDNKKSLDEPSKDTPAHSKILNSSQPPDQSESISSNKTSDTSLAVNGNDHQQSKITDSKNTLVCKNGRKGPSDACNIDENSEHGHDVCDINNTSSINEKSTDNDHISQNHTEGASDNGKSIYESTDEVQIGEITEELKDIAVALKNSLPISDDSDTISNT